MFIYHSVFRLVGTVVPILLFWGCASIPEGDAPRGTIVDTTPPRNIYTTNEAINRFATSMAAGLLRHYSPGSVIVCRQEFIPPNPSYNQLPLQVIAKSGDLFVFRFSSMPSAPVLNSTVRKGTQEGDYWWYMSLNQGSRKIWQESCIIRIAPEYRESK